MVYSNQSILKDFEGKPIPQYWNKELEIYEPVTGNNGLIKVVMVDEKGNQIITQDLINQLNSRIDVLVKAVEKIGL